MGFHLEWGNLVSLERSDRSFEGEGFYALKANRVLLHSCTFFVVVLFFFNFCMKNLH